MIYWYPPPPQIQPPKISETASVMYKKYHDLFSIRRPGMASTTIPTNIPLKQSNPNDISNTKKMVNKPNDLNVINK